MVLTLLTPRSNNQEHFYKRYSFCTFSVLYWLFLI